MKKVKEIWGLMVLKIKSMPIKKQLVLGVILLLIIIGAVWLGPKVFKPAPKQVYDVAIMVRSQHNSNPKEELANSLRAGDVLLTQNEGHKWSKTESVSYLILKMNLNEKQRAKLTAPEERELKKKELSEEQRQRMEEEEKRAKEEDRDYEPEPQMLTLRARRYYIDLAKQFPEFKALDLLDGQPFQNQVYDWSIVSKKPRVK